MRFPNPLDDVFKTSSHVRVLRALWTLPAGLPVSGREIARRAGVSHPTASSVLSSLATVGIVSMRRMAHADAYALNEGHVLFRPLELLVRWERQALGEVVAFLADQLREIDGVKAAYLFGSAARGDMTPSSDLDLAVIANKGASRIESDLQPVVDAVRRKFGNRLSPIVGAGSLASLSAQSHSGSELWKRIAAHGIPVLSTAGAAAS